MSAKLESEIDRITNQTIQSVNWNLHAAARLLKAAAVSANVMHFVYSEMANSYSALRKNSLPLRRCLRVNGIILHCDT